MCVCVLLGNVTVVVMVRPRMCVCVCVLWGNVTVVVMVRPRMCVCVSFGVM